MWRRIDEARSNFSTVAFIGELAAMQIGKVSNRLIEVRCVRLWQSFRGRAIARKKATSRLNYLDVLCCGTEPRPSPSASFRSLAIRCARCCFIEGRCLAYSSPSIGATCGGSRFM